MNNWISTKDRLPEAGGWYICYIDNEITMLAYVPNLPQSNNIWQNKVTHWMPFPEPPIITEES